MTEGPPLSTLVVDALRFFFADQALVDVGALLLHQCGYNLPLAEDAELVERIRLAVLKGAGGDRTEVTVLVVAAKVDWRDVLVAAGFGDDVQAHVKWVATLSRPPVPALPHPMDALRTLIDMWCETRDLHPLSRTLPAYLAVNGLTDGWETLRDAVRSVTPVATYAEPLRDIERALDSMLDGRR